MGRCVTLAEWDGALSSVPATQIAERVITARKTAAVVSGTLGPETIERR